MLKRRLLPLQLNIVHEADNTAVLQKAAHLHWLGVVRWLRRRRAALILVWEYVVFYLDLIDIVWDHMNLVVCYIEHC